MTTLCRQLLLQMSALGHDGDSISSISKLWSSIKEQRAPVARADDIKTSEGGETFAGKVGFIGLGSMGGGMASGDFQSRCQNGAVSQISLLTYSVAQVQL